MSRTLGRDHGHIHILGRYDTAEMNVEAVREHQHIAGLQVGFDIILIQGSLQFIVDQDHDDIGSLRRLCRREYLESLCLGLRPGFGTLIQTNDHMTAGFLRVQGMCMSLASVPDHRDRLPFQKR